MIQHFFAAASTVLLATCGVAGNPTVTVDDRPPAPVVAACERTVFTGWDDVPSCDMDGSQTWILSEDVKWYDHVYLDYLAECQDSGGVFAYHDWDDPEVTVTCINVDY